jgi:TRC40/GET3/ArsA family transport-energizing ATPase
VDGLAERSLLIFAGKGGVGKTTTSSAVALHLASLGKKTLLVTVDPAKRLEDSLGVPVGATETPVQPNLTAMMLDPEAVIREHLERELPDIKITEHPLFRSVASAMPGLNELMAIGKLNDFRRAGKYDAIVIDTAPTGHALSFLGVPRAMRDLMSEKSLLRWAMRGYQVWQKLQGAAHHVGKVFGKSAAKPPDIDFERVFADIEREAKAIQAFLADPTHSALVTLPEMLPVEETVDLHEAVTKDLGMRVFGIVVNKVQPDALAGQKEAFQAIAGDAVARKSFVAKAAQATGASKGLVDSLLHATEFAQVRRSMNEGHMEELLARLPGIPVVQVPLFKEDVRGLRRLRSFGKSLFDPANQVVAEGLATR